MSYRSSLRKRISLLVLCHGLIVVQQVMGGVIDNYLFQEIRLFDTHLRMEYFQDSGAVKKTDVYVINNYKSLFKYHKPDNHQTNVANRSSTIIWLHFRVDTILDADYVIKCLPYYKKVTYYYFGPDSTLHKEATGLEVPFQQWKYKSNMFTFPLRSQSLKHYFLKFEFYDSFTIAAFRIISISDLVNFNFTNFIIYAILLSFIALIFVIAVVFYFFNKEKQNLYYGLYALFFGFFLVSSMHIWPMVVSLAFDQHENWVYYVPFSLSTICFALYIIYATNLSSKANLVKALYGILAFKFITILLQFSDWDLQEWTSSIFAKVDPLIYLLLIFLIAKEAIYHRSLYHYWLTIGAMVLAIAQVLHTFSNVSDWIFYVMFFDIFWFGIGLAINYRTLKGEKIKALEEVIQIKSGYNKELEMTVQERTLQLKQNLKEIDDLNSVLKLNNITLATNLIKLEQNRVLNKELGFEEFQAQFPNTEYCFKFLAELKWKNGFVCNECANTEYFLLKRTDPYLRKCTKCPKIHSPTSNTLFHNLKFPLEKAFYIVFLTTSGKKYGIEQISSIISLRPGTVGNFKKKVEERMELKKFAKHPEMTWQDLIL